MYNFKILLMLLVCDNIGHECSTTAAGKHVGEYWQCWASSCDQWSTPCRQCQCWWSSWYRIEPRTTAGADLTFFLLVFWICTVYTSFCWYFSKCEIIAANEHGDVHLVESVKPVLFVSEMKLDHSLFMLTIFYVLVWHVSVSYYFHCGVSLQLGI